MLIVHVRPSSPKAPKPAPAAPVPPVAGNLRKGRDEFKWNHRDGLIWIDMDWHGDWRSNLGGAFELLNSPNFQSFSIKPRTLPRTKSSTWPTVQVFHDSTWRWPDALPRCLKDHLMKSPEANTPILQTFFKLIVNIGRRCKWHWHPVQVGSRKGLFCWVWKSSMRLSPLLFACLHRACKWSCRDLAERQTQATGWLQRLQRCPIGDLHFANSELFWVKKSWPKHHTQTCVFDLKDVLYSYIRDIMFVEIRPSSFTSQRLEICAKIGRTWFFSPPQSDFNLAWTRRTVATRTGQKLQYKRRGGMQTLVWQDFPDLRAGTTGSGAHVQLCATISSTYPIHPANGPGAQGHFHWEAFKTTERWKECLKRHQIVVEAMQLRGWILERSVHWW